MANCTLHTPSARRDSLGDYQKMLLSPCHAGQGEREKLPRTLLHMPAPEDGQCCFRDGFRKESMVGSRCETEHFAWEMKGYDLSASI
ncbi:hypothetical protein JOH52_007080 [Sinorhizobium meliloti]|nr:hypothetical protein [Sinorhizobium meliloti]MDE3786097.1 hypothetical protein [Sinorhizobium meliloti]GEC42102.1 hypothetical protein EME01_61740 [Sinorhizobium meliloti]